ncbi:MAG: hypothetical protein ACYDH5_16010 [Acidimicrobiales bacterium]
MTVEEARDHRRGAHSEGVISAELTELVAKEAATRAGGAASSVTIARP